MKYTLSELIGLGIPRDSLDLAERVLSLKSEDPSIISVEFSRDYLVGYQDSLFLMASVRRNDPFETVYSFRKYLENHDLPSDKIINSENGIGFMIHPHSPNAFYADFVQPSRLGENSTGSNYHVGISGTDFKTGIHEPNFRTGIHKPNFETGIHKPHFSGTEYRAEYKK